MGRGAASGVAASAVAGLLAAVALVGCGAVTNRFSDEHTDAVPVSAITLDGGSGAVTVSSGPDGSVRVRRQVTYAGKKPGTTYQLTGTTLALNTSCGSQCSVSYDVTAPAGVRVSGRNGSGALNLSGVSTVAVEVGSGAVTVHRASGNVDVRTGSGAIQLTEVRGSAVARAGSGAIRLTGVGGSASANAESGSVTVQLASPNNVTARTGSGAIRVTVPAGDRYRVAASSGSGHVDVKVPTDPGADHVIDVHTSSGGITVDAA